MLSLYRSRAGQTRMLDRKVDKLYTVVMMFVIQPIVYLCAVKTTAFAEISRALLPLSGGWLERIAPAALAVAAAVSLGVAGFEIAKPNRSPGKLLYTVVILLHPLLLYAGIHSGIPGSPTSTCSPICGATGSSRSGWWAASTPATTGGRAPREPRRSGAMCCCSARSRAPVWLLTYPYTDYGLFNTDGFRYKQLLAQIGPGRRS